MSKSLVQSPLLNVLKSADERQRVLDIAHESGHKTLVKIFEKYISREQDRLIQSGSSSSTDDIRKTLLTMQVLQGIIDMPAVIAEKVRKNS